MKIRAFLVPDGKDSGFSRFTFYSQFQIAFPRALANFVGKLGTTYRTSKFGSQLANELANFKSKFATSPAQKYSKSAKSATRSWRICQNWKVLSVLLRINWILMP